MNLNKSKMIITPLAMVAVTTALATSGCSSNSPFASAEMDSAHKAKTTMHKEGKCGEGKCGGDKKSKEGKCGEGKCGGNKMKKEGKCGEGKCGGSKMKKEGKCGEGKCGAKKKKKKEGSCGAHH